jgi:hypothetical protein
MLTIPTGDPDSLLPEDANLRLSMAEPTYWPSDRNKLSDLVDFCVTKGIPQDFAVAKSCFDLYSDLSPVLMTLKHMH